MNLIEIIFEEMWSDDANRDKQSDLLKKRYKQATDKEKNAIDDTLVCLCGWSLNTLIINAKGE
ncbi:MAG: hypothetical protein ACRBBR_06575 [Cellvibrionaceae bacterium]